MLFIYCLHIHWTEYPGGLEIVVNMIKYMDFWLANFKLDILRPEMAQRWHNSGWLDAALLIWKTLNNPLWKYIVFRILFSDTAFPCNIN